MSDDPILTEVRALRSELTSQFASLETRLIGLEARLASLEGELARLRSDMLHQHRRILSSLESIRDELRLNLNAASIALRASDPTRAELRILNDQVLDLMRRVTRLSRDIDELRRGRT